MKKLRLLLIVLVLVSCAPQPTPDLKATETAIAYNVIATLTAQVPTLTLTPVATNTPKPTDTPKPTATPAATNTPIVTSTPGATPTPTPDLALKNYKKRVQHFGAEMGTYSFDQAGATQCYADLRQLNKFKVPEGAEEFHDCFIEAYELYCEAILMMVEAKICLDGGFYDEAIESMKGSDDKVAEMGKQLRKCERLLARLP